MPRLTKPSDGYFLAKKQMQEALDYRISFYLNEATKAAQGGDERMESIARAKIAELEDVRKYVRNVMLWSKLDGK